MQTERALDWLDDYLDQFSEFARSEFQSKGRGAVVIAADSTDVPPEDHGFTYASHAALLDNDMDDELLELVGVYDPDSEFVVHVAYLEEELFYSGIYRHTDDGEGELLEPEDDLDYRSVRPRPQL